LTAFIDRNAKTLLIFIQNIAGSIIAFPLKFINFLTNNTDRSLNRPSRELKMNRNYTTKQYQKNKKANNL